MDQLTLTRIIQCDSQLGKTQLINKMQLRFFCLTPNANYQINS